MFYLIPMEPQVNAPIQSTVEVARPREGRLIRLGRDDDAALGRRIDVVNEIGGSRMIIPFVDRDSEVLDAEIYDGLDRDQFSVVFQPEHELGDHVSILGYEVLARWERPGRGLLLPHQFLPRAASSRDAMLLSKVNLKIAEHAFKEYCVGRAAGLISGDSELSINLSCKAASEQFVKKLVDELLIQRVDSKKVSVEFRADELNNSDDLIHAMHALREVGVNVVIDGFSLRTPGLSFVVEGLANRIKLSRSFVAGISANSREKVALGYVMMLAHEMGATVYANGIEVETQLERVRSAGLQRGQGFLLSQPIAFR